MGLYGLMTTSISGMAVQSDRMGTVADNIANVNTTGYKEASAEFATLVAEGHVASYVPGSVSTIARRAITHQGDLTYTTSPTDLAVSGNGFFMVQSPSGTPYLTRAGSFVSTNGYLVNAAGFTLLGYDLLSGGSSSVINSAAGLVPVGTANLGLKATPSTSGNFQVNLPSDAAVSTSLPSLNAAGADYVGPTSIVTYDNLGHQVTIDIYSAKTADNQWEVTVYDHAGAASGGGSSFPYAAGSLLTTENLTFDGTNGKLISPSPPTLSVSIPNGATLNLNMGNTTQLATAYTPVDASVNGNGPSAVDRLEISDEGIVTAVYADGSRVDAFKIPLATVASPDNLTAISGNVFATNKDSGDLQLGTANSGSLGKIVSGALEKSSVDLASELTTMVEAQRSYTANSKVFQTGTELLDVLVNLVR
ncbi:flagellar hook protein FlgE [Hyphomicrobium denitrificans]|nr:flagellar hook protein FlgE [Hyphomicrobium denitrificans]